MQIFVDADACPVKEIIVRLAKRYKVDVTMVMDTSHQYSDGYSKVITVDKSRDSADMKLVSLIGAGDAVITQDYGVATMALSKGALAIHQNGFSYTDQNIDQLLFERFLSQKARQAGKRGGRNRRRTNEDDAQFERELENVLQNRVSLDEGI